MDSFGSLCQEFPHPLVMLVDETDDRSHVDHVVVPHGLENLPVLRGPVTEEGAPGGVLLLGMIVPGKWRIGKMVPLTKLQT